MPQRTVRHLQPNNVTTPFTELLEGPDQARWRASHEGCDPERGGSHYLVAAEKLRTRADLLDWTAHLMEKNWLSATDWRDLLREARKGGERLAVITPEASRGTPPGSAGPTPSGDRGAEAGSSGFLRRRAALSLIGPDTLVGWEPLCSMTALVT
ncbi:hypothetical protein ACFQ2K_51235 [Streptomyces sanglieri]|uniref:Uncharacterized protein n=1 Tax=Streptomyces sanglieri TaxID=193460 RepID=A0ABW2XD48_9ACTN